MLSHTIAEESHNSFCPLFGEVGGRVRDMFLVKQEARQASTPESKEKVKILSYKTGRLCTSLSVGWFTQTHY
jgi:hypothetical protein